MKTLARHVSRCLIGGIVALLPIGGAILGVVYLESVLTESWRDDASWYFPGLGLLLGLAVIYCYRSGGLLSAANQKLLWWVSMLPFIYNFVVSANVGLH